MLKLNTKIYKAIEFEINGVSYQTKKITNRVIMEGLRISNKMQAVDTDQLQAYDLLIDLLVLYTPLKREWILDEMNPADVQKIVEYITAEVTKTTGGSVEPPLAGGATGAESLK
jgi:hypothetical protein